ncbi:hypothetical protein HK102_006109, partial [Quaeritorhiza haematococci]
METTGIVKEKYLCQIGDAYPDSIKNGSLVVRWHCGDLEERGGVPQFEKLQKFFRRFVDIRWYAGGDPYAVLASAHHELRVFMLNLETVTASEWDRTARTRLLSSFSSNLVAFNALTGGRNRVDGKELVLLGKTCPNLKAVRCFRGGTVTNEELEDFLSTVGPSLEFFSSTIYSREQLYIIARHCRSIKHLHIISMIGDIKNDALAQMLTLRAFEDLIRNVGSTILTLFFGVLGSRISIGQHVLQTIGTYCPHIQQIRIREMGGPGPNRGPLQLVNENDGNVNQLFEHCKKLV